MTSRTKAILSLGGVFLAGVLCGALVLGIVVRDRAHQAERLRDPEGFEQYFVERLKLTEAQRDSLKDELERTYAELAGLRHSTADEYREVLDTLRQRISPQLTTEQRELLAEVDLRFRRSIPREGPLPGRRWKSSGDNVPMPTTPAPLSTSVRRDSSTIQPKAEAPGPQERATPKLKADTVVMPDENLKSSDESGMTGLADKLQERLKLNDDQAKQVNQIVRQTRQRLRRARTELAENPIMLRAAMQRNLREMDQQIVAVLTPEQMEPYKEVRKDLRERFRRSLEQRR